MPFSRYSTFSDGNLACFCITFCIKKTGINKLSGSPQWHITFDLNQVALKFKKSLTGEKPSFISIVFQILQNNWLPWKLSKMPKLGHVTTFLSNNITKSSKINQITS